MSGKNNDAAGSLPGKNIFHLRGRLLVPIALLIACSACDHRETRKEQTAAAPVTSVFSYSCALTPADGLEILSVLNDATMTEEKDRLIIRANGPDAQLGFRVTTEGRRAVSLDITSPGDTLLELFYQVRNIYQDQNNPFSAKHVLTAALKSGRNQLLLLIDDPQFGGGLRLDPGQIPGDYSLHSLQVYSDTAVSFAHKVVPQAELEASFNKSSKIVFSAKTNGAWGLIKPLNDAQLVAEENGLSVTATGGDPQLLLPELELGGDQIIKVVLVSPAATVLQLFCKTQSGLDYNEARSTSQPLASGENTVYLKVPAPNASGALRLDPGAVAGNYLLKDLEFRSSTE